MSALTYLCRICLGEDLGCSLFDDKEAELISKLELCLQEQVLDQVGYPRHICKTCKDKLDMASDLILKYKNTCQVLESGILLNEVNNFAVKIEPIFINSCDYANNNDNIDNYDEAEHNSKNTCQVLESGILLNEVNNFAVKIEPIFINSCDYANNNDNIDNYDEAKHNSKNTRQVLESGLLLNEVNKFAVKIETIFMNSCDYANNNDNIDNYDDDNIDHFIQEAEHNSKDESKSHHHSQSSLKKILSNFKHITVKKIKKEPQDEIKEEKLSSTPRIKQLKLSKVGKAGVTLVKKNQIKKEPQEEPILCDICAEVLKSSASLQHHKNKMHFPKKLECEQCARVFTTKINLRRHFNNVHGDKKFICYACGKSFGANNNLTKHLNTVHREEKKIYKCQYCEKPYACRLSVIIHERSAHTGLRPAVCDVCNKSFYHKVYLQEHMRLHTGETPFKCPVCGRGYAIRANMKSHMKNHKLANIDPDVVAKLRPSLLKMLKL